MAKNIIICLLVYLNLWLSASADTEADLRQCIVNTAKSQVGVRESTGRNDGKAVKGFLQSVGLKEGYAWCAAFVSWCMQQCCVPNVRSALAADYFRDKSKIIYDRRYPQTTKPIHQGDLGGINFPELGGIHHIVFILKWDSMVNTVEGNTNDQLSRDGDGVYYKKRLRSQIFQVAKAL